MHLCLRASRRRCSLLAFLARAGEPVLWVSEHFDLFAPALASAGLESVCVLRAEAGRKVLAGMKKELRHPDLCGIVGEVFGHLGLTASRRLQLAVEATGAIALLKHGMELDDGRPQHHEDVGVRLAGADS